MATQIHLLWFSGFWFVGSHLGNAIVLISELGLSPREEKGVKSGPPDAPLREQPQIVPALSQRRMS